MAIAVDIGATLAIVALSTLGLGGIGIPETGALLAIYAVSFVTVMVRRIRQARLSGHG